MVKVFVDALEILLVLANGLVNSLVAVAGFLEGSLHMPFDVFRSVLKLILYATVYIRGDLLDVILGGNITEVLLD